MSDLRSLIEAAKADAPNAAARAKVWAGVSSAVGGAGALSGGGAAAGSATAAKMLVVGTLLGGTMTIGLGAAILFMHAEPRPTAPVSAAAPASGERDTVPPAGLPPLPAAVHEGARGAGAGGDSIAVSAVSPLQLAVVNPAPRALPLAATEASKPEASKKAAAAAAARAAAREGDGVASGATKAQGDALAREASLLAEARNALARGDGFTALQTIRGLRALPARQLEPEELALEALALRSLGLNDDANAVDAQLHDRFPESVLGR